MRSVLRLAGVLALVSGGWSAGILLLASRGVPRPDSPAAELDASGRTRGEREAVTSCARSEGLRPAEDPDAIDFEARRDLENLYAGYRPYFVRGDLNGDGVLDFVQGFVRPEKTGPWFDVAVFFGLKGGGFARPVFVERAVSLAAGDLSLERSLLIVTPDVSADRARRWRWEEAERRFVDADAAPPDEDPDDAPEESPDNHPRAKV